MKPTRWSLERLIDFEAEVAKRPAPPASQRVVEQTSGMNGLAARRVGLSIWLDEFGNNKAGHEFLSALRRVTLILILIGFVAGVTAISGLVDSARGGVHVVLFLTILLGGQWLLMATGLLLGLLRHTFGINMSGIVTLVLSLAKRFMGKAEAPWWSSLVLEPGQARQAMIWRAMSSLSISAIAFNLGILAGLAGWVMFRHIGFFWETTTDLLMRDTLATLGRCLSAPWASWFPAAVPDEALIDAARWVPGRPLSHGAGVWWKFLMMSVVFWGLFPRLVFGLIAIFFERRTLRNMEFLERRHRKLWRNLVGVSREDTHEAPLDGVLVIDVGGSSFQQDALRPFLLRSLRLNPVAWHSVAVLDMDEETKTSAALAKAPAGVVIVSEAWSLTGPRMKRLHHQVRAATGPDKPIRFLVMTITAQGEPAEPSAEEKSVWETFVDGLDDAETEVCFYQRIADPV